MTTATRTDLELADAHKYRLPNGDVAVNVTTISGLLDMGKSGAMAGAAVKLTREGLNYRQEWTAKADTGTRVHGVCEKWLLSQVQEVADDELLVTEGDQGYIDALEKFWLDHDPRLVECEGVALSTRGYGGRFDVVADLADGRRGLVDLKTGRKYPVEHTLQLAAYRFAGGIATYADDGMLAGLRPMPAVDFAACLYVHEDGTFELVEYAADEGAFLRFVALLGTYQWAKEIERGAA